MSLTRYLAAGLRGLFRRTQVEQELDEELGTFLDMATEKHLASGKTSEQAERAARLEIGSFAVARENVRDAGWESVVDTCWQDVRLGLRTLRRSPIVTLVAIVSLALGIGATTALFSLYDSLLLRELPVREPDRLVLLADSRPYPWWTNVMWEEIRSRPNLFDRACAYGNLLTARNGQLNLTYEGKTEPVEGLLASARFFDVLGVPATLGRTFRESDDRRGGGPDGPVAVISYGFWQRRLGGTPDVIGRSLTIERVPFTIVGVTPPGFFGVQVGRALDVVVPIGIEPLFLGQASLLDSRDARWLRIAARLKPGQTPAAALSALHREEPHIRSATRPAVDPTRPSPSSGAFELRRMETGESLVRTSYQRPLTLIMGVSALVLLIACANIANLLLARAAARRHEIGVRRALGASRLRLARLCLVESLLLSAGGAVLGLVFARWGSQVSLAQLSSVDSTFFLRLPLDWRVLGFTGAAAVATAMLFGMAPAWQASRVGPAEVLGASGRTLAGDRRQRLGQALVVAQVALSLVLVVAAVLFLRTYAALATLDVGFDRDRVLIATVDVQRAGPGRAERLQAADRIRAAVAVVPGVAEVSTSWQTPATGLQWIERLAAADYPSLSDADRRVLTNYVSPGWFATYGTQMRAGRDFTESDRTEVPTVVIVNEAFARRHLGERRAVVGQTVRIARRPDSRTLEIVGLARDSVSDSLREEMPPMMYLPLTSVPFFGYINISVRSASGRLAHLGREVETAIRRLDANVGVTIRPLAAQVDATLMRERLVAMLSAFFGGLALLMAALGLYGVTAYAVGRRRAEIGVRLALGAAPGSVVRLVLRRVAILVGAGTVIGVVASFWAAQLTKTLLFGLTPRDPLSFAGAALVLTATGLLAGWLPARRAARIDPATVLRNE
jgi:putative ABC transport system permease protein